MLDAFVYVSIHSAASGLGDAVAADRSRIPEESAWGKGTKLPLKYALTRLYTSVYLTRGL